MPIRVSCNSCGTTLKAKDSAAGMSLNCPKCGGIVDVPDPEADVYDAEETSGYEDDYDDSYSDGYDDYDDGYSGAAPARRRSSDGGTKPCPVCGESIKRAALKCRFCGEIFDPSLRRSQRGSRGQSHGYSRLGTPGSRLCAQIVDGLISVPIVIGVLVGAAVVDQGDEGVGVAIIGFSMLLALGLMVYQLILLSTQGQTIGKRVMSLQIVMYEDESPAGFVHAVLLRGFVNGLICAIPYLGGCYSLIDILFIFGDEHRCLHDMLAGTKVIDIS